LITAPQKALQTLYVASAIFTLDTTYFVVALASSDAAGFARDPTAAKATVLTPKEVIAAATPTTAAAF
jgi:hypothetical protein